MTELVTVGYRLAQFALEGEAAVILKVCFRLELVPACFIVGDIGGGNPTGGNVTLLQGWGGGKYKNRTRLRFCGEGGVKKRKRYEIHFATHAVHVAPFVADVECQAIQILEGRDQGHQEIIFFFFDAHIRWVYHCIEVCGGGLSQSQIT